MLLLLLLFLTVAEVTLRAAWGFGNMVLYDEDKDYEYIAKPNQHTRRFGNMISYNEHAMRSGPLTPADKCVVLGFGDSVINGGTLTDQDSLATTIVEKKIKSEADGFRFLNISAGSWGPDNCAAYLKRNGSFNANMIVLMVSSHDAHDNMTFEDVVGVHEAYPGKQYPLATAEVVIKYLIPRAARMVKSENKAPDLMINKEGEGFNSGFIYFKEFADKNNIPLLVCLHAEKPEAELKKFNEQGEEILAYCSSNSIKVISGLAIGEEAIHYRDDIHLNEHGQRLWANVLEKEIRQVVSSCLN